MKLFLFLFILLIITSIVEAQVTTQVIMDSPSITAGENVLVQINIFEKTDQPIRDVKVFYFLTDRTGGMINQGSRTIAIQSQSSIVISLSTSENTPPGDYLLVAEVRELETNKVLSSASGNITVQHYKRTANELLNHIAIYGLTGGIIIILFVLLWQHHEWHSIKEEELKKYNQLQQKWNKVRKR